MTLGLHRRGQDGDRAGQGDAPRGHRDGRVDLRQRPAPAARTRSQAETGITVFESNLDVVKHSDVLVLAVKPQSMSQVLAELRRR